MGGITLGGGAPVCIQSMTNTDTRDVDSTVAQIEALTNAGCELVRMSVYDSACVKAIGEIKKRVHVPLVADISSCILSRPIDVSRFGVLYAGAQKNVAPAGLTIVIIREDLIGEPQEKTPTMFMYKTHAESDSMYNTPPCYSIYMCKLVLEWLKNEVGGLKAMEKRNVEKAALLYDFLDRSKLFKGCAEKESRSIMNVTFVTGDKDLDAKFVQEAAAAGFVNLKGHRSVGGMRASIYNAMPREGVEKLVQFMENFEKENA
mgnify:CR=1 FL=1